ncbi:MAG: hypothetical protein HYZ53_09370 [Planctomycetes bacterium]|nr:hypothetical protein [Planctomycetota bacterium]
MSPRGPRLLPLVVVLWLLFSAGRRPVDAANDPSLVLDVDVGLAGVHVSGRWAPLRVVVTNLGPDFVGELVVLPVDNVHEWERHSRPVELPRNSRKAFCLYACLPAQGSVAVGLSSRDRRHWVELTLQQEPEGAVVGLVGKAMPHADPLSRVTTPAARVVALEPENLPDRWQGYQALDWAIVYQPDSSTFARPEQAQAFATWIRAGGRAVVVASRGADPIRGTVFESLLPATLGEMRELARATGSPQVPAGPFTISRVTNVRGKVVASEPGDPVVIRGRTGVGEVLLLTFDPAAAPFSTWEALPTFWKNLYRPKTSSTEETKETRDSAPWRGAWGADPVVELLERYPVAEPVSFGWLSLLFLVYALVLGPGDWFLLRRLRRPGWMWGTLLLWVGVFGYAVFWVSMRGRGENLSLRRISIMDMDGEASWATGRVYAALYTPSAGRFDVAGEDGSAFVAHRSAIGAGVGGGYRPSRRQPFESGGGVYEESDGVSLRGVWMWSAMMKHFDASWSSEMPARSLGLRARLVRGKLELSNEGRMELADLALVGKGQVWAHLGNLGAGQVRTAELGEPISWDAWGQQLSVGGEPADWRYGHRSVLREWPVFSKVVRNAICAASIAPASKESGFRRRSGSELCNGVSSWVAGGGKVLLGTLPRAPYAVGAPGTRPEELDVTVVRLFLPETE